MSTDALPLDPADWKSSRTARFGAIFDGIVEYYKNAPHSVGHDSRSATLASRRIALCMWKGHLRSREEDLYQLSDQMHHRQSPNHPHGWFSTWALTWRLTVFRKLMFGKAVIARTNADLQSISNTLGVTLDGRSMLDQDEAAEWRSATR